MSVAGLSIAANTFAPVGLADIAFRLGKALYETLSRFKDAPKDVIELLEIVRRLENSIAGSSAYISQYEKSLFVTKDGQTIPDLNDLLQGCTNEFTKLNKMLNEAAIRQGDSYKIQWTKRTRLLVSETELKKSSRVLDNYINAVGVALATIQGQSQIKLREQAALVRTDISDMQAAVLANTTARAVALEANVSSTNTGVQSLIDSSTKSTKETICITASNIQQDILVLSNDVRGDLLDSSNAIRAVTQAVEFHLNKHELTSNKKHDVLRKNVSHFAVKTENVVQTVRTSVVRAHKDQRTFAKQQERRNDKLLRGMSELLASVRINETSNSNLQVEGHNLEAVLIPLLIIKPEITKMLATLSRCGKMTITNSELSWLENELETLIRISFESREVSTQPQKTVRPSKRESGMMSRNLYCLRAKFKRQRARAIIAHHYLMTSIGKIAIRRYHHSSSSSGKLRDEIGEIVITFSFFPSQSSCWQTGFKAIFSSHSTSLPRHMTTWEILPHTADVFGIIKNDDVCSLGKLIQTGAPSIYACDESGNSLLALAMLYGSVRTFDLLVQQGACMRTTRSYAFMSHLIEQPKHLTQTAEQWFTDWHYMMVEAFETGFEPSDIVIDIETDYTLIISLCEYVDANSHLSTKQIIAVARILLENGDKLNKCDASGMTPLLCLCNRANFGKDLENDRAKYSLLEYILDEGANPQATDLEGRNCLHYLIMGAGGKEPQYWSSFKILALRCLISAGCDPNGLDNIVMTPFDYQYQYKMKELPLWHVIFDNTPFEAMVIEAAWMEEVEACVVVVERGTSQLPVTGLSSDQWIGMRAKKLQTWWSQMEELDNDISR